jgi:hypothetical protein
MDQPKSWTRLERKQSSQLERVDQSKLTSYHGGGSDRHGDWLHLPAEAREPETEPQSIQVHSKVAQSGMGRIAAGGRKGPATPSGLETTEPSGQGGREAKWQIIII